MIPHIIHYVWIGGAPLPELAERCIASWRKYMPDWQMMRWDEAALSQALSWPNLNPSLKGRTVKQPTKQSQDTHNWLEHMPLYVKQAYEAKKYAFVSDYVRLWALEQYGGLYMDIDFEVFRPFDDLMDRYPAFAGYEGSKRQPVMMGVIASEPHGAWVQAMMATYADRPFVLPDGSLDMTPNTGYFADWLEAQGFVPDGKEKDVYITAERLNELTSERESGKSSLNTQHSTLNVYFLHVFPVHYFCPVLTTGEDVRTEETYCIHRGLHSWSGSGEWKAKVLSCFGPRWRTKLIKLKRYFFG